MLANSPYSDSDESISSGSSGVSGVSKICYIYKIYRIDYHRNALSIIIFDGRQ